MISQNLTLIYVLIFKYTNILKYSNVHKKCDSLKMGTGVDTSVDD